MKLVQQRHWLTGIGLIAIAILLSPLAAQAEEPNMVPIPPAEMGLTSQKAKDWIMVAPGNNVLEGAIFDKDGNLLFCDVTARKVMCLSADKKLSTLVEVPDLSPGGLAFHRDGRLFMAALDLAKGKGGVLAWTPATNSIETIIPPEAGYWPNDLVFAPDGGFYFSDFRGAATRPEGGIYYVAPDLKTIKPVIVNMAQANGVALSPDGKTLWATEFATNRLHRVDLADAVTIPPTGSAIPYQFQGPAPDSMRVDRDGNVYVAIYGQGRALVFNQKGLPIGQVLLPERESGHNLLSTSLAIHPGAKELFMVSGDDGQEGAARIFSASALAPGLAPQNAKEAR